MNKWFPLLLYYLVISWHPLEFFSPNQIHFCCLAIFHILLIPTSREGLFFIFETITTVCPLQRIDGEKP